MATKIKVLSDPFALIGIMISIVLLTNIVTNLFPTIITNLLLLAETNESLGGVGGNFTFGTLFASGGMMSLIVSAIVLIAVLALLGIRTSGSKR